MTRAWGAPVAIGLGNQLLGDDGVGLRVIDELRRLAAREPGSLPPDTRLVAAGTPSLDLLAVARDARAVVLIDAVDAGRSPGTIAVVRDEQVDSTVGLGEVGELLIAMRLTGHAPGAVALVGIQVAAMEPGVGLSAPIEPAVAEGARLARRELIRMTVPDRSADPRSSRPHEPAAEVYA